MTFVNLKKIAEILNKRLQVKKSSWKNNLVYNKRKKHLELSFFLENRG